MLDNSCLGMYLQKCELLVVIIVDYLVALFLRSTDPCV